jgi:hypothetical protein
MLALQIQDNFFTEKEFKIIINNLNKIDFKPSTNEDYHHFSFNHEFDPDDENQWIFNKIKNIFFKENLNVVRCRFDMRHNKNQVIAHVDSEDTSHNCIIYLKGDELLHNGTGFYYKNNLHSYVGFVKNRALFFNGSKVYHTDLQGLGPSSMRYTLNIFYERVKNG